MSSSGHRVFCKKSQAICSKTGKCRENDEARMSNVEVMTNVKMTNNPTVVPSEVEESRGETEEQFRGILRLRFASLRMTIGYSDFVIISSFVIRHSSFSSLICRRTKRSLVCSCRFLRCDERTIWESAISARCGTLLIGLQKLDLPWCSFC